MKILVVDDQELNRTLLGVMLKQEGHEILSVGDGQQALDVFDSFRPDLVLLDVMMPVLDGFAAAPLLKAKSPNIYLPIIFITALEDQASLLRCLEVGGDDFLNKPFDKVILGAKIKAHQRTRMFSLESFKQRQELEYYRLHTEREHELVEHIFDNALKERLHIPHIVSYHMSPASMFNGDLFLIAASNSGGLYAMMGDFTGHGLAAATGALPVAKVFYSMTQKGLSVGDIAAEINHVLNDLLPPTMFCAANIIELSPSGKSMSVWLGGLPDSYLVDTNGNVVKELCSNHMALGVLEDDEFERDVMYIETQIGHRLVMFTDGVIEAENSEGEQFSELRILEQLKRQEIDVEDIIAAVKGFVGSDVQQDDFSLAMINCDACMLPVNQSHTYTHLPLNLSLHLNTELLKSSDPVIQVVDIISSLKGVDQHRSNLFLLISELYNNALEHGVLNLDSSIKDQEDGFYEYYIERENRLKRLTSGYINVHVTYEPDSHSVNCTIEDSGDGFARSVHSEDEQFHGRGISLVSEIADSVTYNESGNCVTIKYSLNL